MVISRIAGLVLVLRVKKPQHVKPPHHPTDHADQTESYQQALDRPTHQDGRHQQDHRQCLVVSMGLAHGFTSSRDGRCCGIDSQRLAEYVSLTSWFTAPVTDSSDGAFARGFHMPLPCMAWYASATPHQCTSGTTRHTHRGDGCDHQ